MSQLTFQLKQDLILPATGNPSKGYLLFPKSEFGLSYEVKPNPKKKVLYVTLAVAELSTDNLVWPLTIYAITENGFGTSTITNQADIDNANASRNTLFSQIAVKDASLSTLITQAENPDLTEEELAILNSDISTLQSELTELHTQLESTVVPAPDYLIINRYDDVIDYFKGDGSLTSEGIEWAKTVYYGDYQLGDLII